MEVICGERPIGELSNRGVCMEIVSCPETIWCGSIAYAPNCEDEPDVGRLLQRYQSLCDTPKRETANPDWSCCISIDYWREGAAPRGMMFAQQVLTRQQVAAHDVFFMPETLYLRAACTRAAAQSLFGKESCEPYELFGAIKAVMEANGYAVNPNGAQEIELYNHAAGLAYAYVPAVKKEH